MIIKPVLPAAPPEFGEAPSLRTLPFHQGSGFLDLLKAATQAKVSVSHRPVSHQVKAGESLWSICRDALKAEGGKPTQRDINKAVHRVTAANQLRDADLLAVGQKLDLSAMHENSLGIPPTLDSRLNAPPLVPAKTAKGQAVLPTSFETARPPILRAPLASLSETRRSSAVGGAAPSPRPLFHRLSNARPAVHAHAHGSSSTEASTPAMNPIDLTALMQSILEPGSEMPVSTPAPGPWSKLLGGAARFTSGFGVRNDPFTGKPQFHQGIDIAAASGTEIYPYMAGTVKSAGWDGGHGNAVVIQHPNGMETVYAHASEVLVKAGDVVLKNTPIAKVGSTGHSTGPHLHFEVRQNNKAINPLPLVKQRSLDVAKAS